MRNEHFPIKNIKYRALIAILLASSLLFFHNGLYDWKARGAPPGFSHVDYEGLYVVDGNETVVLGNFLIFGSLEVKDNATLIVRGDLSIYHSESSPPRVRNRGRIIVEDGEMSAWIWGSQDHAWQTVIGVGSLSLENQAVCEISMSRIYAMKIYVGQNARLRAYNSRLDGVYVGGNVNLENSKVDWVESYGGSFLNVNNTSIDMLICRTYNSVSAVSIMNSSIKTFDVGLNSSVSTSNSAIGWIELSQESSSIVNVNDSDIGLSLYLTQENLTWTVKPFFANCWNIHEHSPLHITEGNLTLKDTNVTEIAIRFEHSSVSLVNSDLRGLACEETSIYLLGCSLNSYLTIWNSNVYMYDSTLETLNCYDSNVTLVNTICSGIDAGVTSSSVEVWWNLEIIINDQIENPQDCTVTIHDQNRSLIASKSINENGITQFTLIEKKISWNRTENVGNYIIHATYGTNSIEKNITLDKSMEVALTVTPFIVYFTKFLTSTLGITIIGLVTFSTLFTIFAWKKYMKPKQDSDHYD